MRFLRVCVKTPGPPQKICGLAPYFLIPNKSSSPWMEVQKEKKTKKTRLVKIIRKA